MLATTLTSASKYNGQKDHSQPLLLGWDWSVCLSQNGKFQGTSVENPLFLLPKHKNFLSLCPQNLIN